MSPGCGNSFWTYDETFHNGLAAMKHIGLDVGGTIFVEQDLT